MKHALPVLLLLCLISAASGQVEIKVEKRLRLEAAGSADVWIWSAPLPLVTEQQGATLYVEGPAGKYRVGVVGLTIDWENKLFSQENGFVDIELGGKPGPGPGPTPKPDDPSIPDDEFGNLGQRVFEWAADHQLNKRAEAAANYEAAAARLLGEKTPILPTIDAAHKFIQEENAKLDLNDGWKKWAVKVNEVWQAQVTDRESAGRFFRVVAVGLKGGE